MVDILITILLFIVLFGIGTAMLVVAFSLCILSKAESEIENEMEGK